MPLRHIRDFIVRLIFPILTLVGLPLGQLHGADLELATRLVFVELRGEPAADVAVRLRAQGVPAAEIAKATRHRIAEIALQQEVFIARLGHVQGALEAQFSRLANA